MTRAARTAAAACALLVASSTLAARDVASGNARTPASGLLKYLTVSELGGLTPNSDPKGIITGADGNVWFTEDIGNRIGRITPSGVVTEFSTGLSNAAYPRDIAAGPDGNLWFTEFAGNRIGRITP